MVECLKTAAQAARLLVLADEITGETPVRRLPNHSNGYDRINRFAIHGASPQDQLARRLTWRL